MEPVDAGNVWTRRWAFLRGLALFLCCLFLTISISLSVGNSRRLRATTQRQTEIVTDLNVLIQQRDDAWKDRDTAIGQIIVLSEMLNKTRYETYVCRYGDGL